MSEPPRSFSERPIWVDATGILRWGTQPFTGVQRVEYGLVRLAMRRADAGVAVMAGESGVFRPASRRMLDYIEAIGRAQEGDPDGPKDLRDALQFIDLDLRFGDNESARRLARQISGARKGLAFTAAKLALRLPIWLRTSADIVHGVAWRLVRGRRAAGVGRHAPFLLVSHEVNRHVGIVSALSGAGLRGANIVYDLIPVFEPAYTPAKYSRSMAAFFRRILTTGEPIVAISQATRDDLLRWNRDVVKADYPHAIAVCPLNSNFKPSDGGERALPALQGRRFALYCSTIDLRKAHHLLVAAWRRLAERLDPAVLPDLALIGRRGTGWDALQAELERSGPLADRIHVLHGVDDDQLRWAYRHAELALFPSMAEGWGLGVSEALAHGTPVVHSDIPVLREAAQNLMPAVAPGDAGAWADALAPLLAAPEPIDGLRRTVRERYEAGSPDDFASGVFAYLSTLRLKEGEPGLSPPAAGLRSI